METVRTPDRILVVDDEPAVREAIEAHLSLAILVSSSAGYVDEAVHYLQYGAMGYLRKPIGLPQLEAALLRGLRRRSELIRERGVDRFSRRKWSTSGPSSLGSGPRSKD